MLSSEHRMGPYEMWLRFSFSKDRCWLKNSPSPRKLYFIFSHRIGCAAKKRLGCYSYIESTWLQCDHEDGQCPWARSPLRRPEGPFCTEVGAGWGGRSFLPVHLPRQCGIHRKGGDNESVAPIPEQPTIQSPSRTLSHRHAHCHSHRPGHLSYRITPRGRLQKF